MKPVLDWVKSNVLVVVLGVVAIGSLVAGWVFSDSMVASTRTKEEARAKKISELASLEKSNITLAIPGKEPTTRQVVINQEVLDEYRKVTEQLKGDADQVHQLALARNKRDHKPVLDNVFPQPPAEKKDVIAFTVHKELMAAYESLLKSVNAGTPPAAADVAEALSRRDSQYIESTLKKASRAQLDAKELAELTEDLTRSRLALYGEQAQKLTVYATVDSLDLPPSPESKKPSLGQLFDWQWKFWLTKDILEAIADAGAKAGGGSSASLLKGPVKRVVAIRIPDLSLPTKAGQSQQGSFGGMNSGFGGDAAPAAPAPEAPAAAPDAAAAAPTIDLTQEAVRDYKRSFTGRVSNPIYDVRLAKAVLIVETARLPELFDALARRNFMTVIDSSIRPADAFAAARDGFIYGKAHVSEVTLTIESVWLREWTVPFMPSDVRTALGVGSAAPAADAGAAPPAG